MNDKIINRFLADIYYGNWGILYSISDIVKKWLNENKYTGLKRLQLDYSWDCFCSKDDLFCECLEEGKQFDCYATKQSMSFDDKIKKWVLNNKGK